MKNITEIKSRLKYLYFIDTDKLIDSIKLHSDYKTFSELSEMIAHMSYPTLLRDSKYMSKLQDSFENLLHLIFEHIVPASKKYSEFIIAERGMPSNSIFSEDPYNQTVNTSFQLSGISIFNHCIVRSFINSLNTTILSATTGSDYFRYDGSISIANKNIEDIRAGYLSSEFYASYSKVEPNSSSNFNNLYGRFFEHKNRTSYKVLASLCNNIDECASNNDPLYVKKHHSNPALFLLYEKKVRQFDDLVLRHIPDNSEKYNSPAIFRVLKKYEHLHQEARNWKNALRTNGDRVLFDSVIEPTYNFSFNSYIYSLYSREGTKVGSAGFALNELFGEDLNRIIKDSAISLPMTYNKSIFLKYAMEALINRDSSKSAYPPQTDDAVKYIPTINKKDLALFANKSKELLRTYYRMLYYVTLPLIEDLWDVLTSEESLGLKIETKHYQAFIQKFFPIISLDYTQMTNCNFSSADSQTSYRDIYHTLYQLSKNNVSFVKHKNSTSATFYEKVYEEIDNTSYKEVTEKIYSDYDDRSTLFVTMKDFFKGNSTTHASPSEELINHLLLPSPPPSTGAPLASEKGTFHDKHLCSLVDFVKDFAI